MKKLLSAFISAALILILFGCSPTAGNVQTTSEQTVPPTTHNSETSETLTSDDTTSTDTYIPAPSAKIKYNIIEGLDAPNAKAGLMYDFSSNSIVFAKNAEDKCYPASITKLLTASVALKYVDSQTVFTVGTEQDLVQPHSSLCLIKPGHALTLHDLIIGMLLPSGNDAAYTVAVNVARTVSGNDKLTDREAVDYFCRLMNEYAEMLGASSSHFNSPEGWHSSDHYSTPYDLLIIALDALENSEIAEIMSTQSQYVVFASGHNITWVNSNKLLDTESEYYYKYATAGKTGSTDEAGKCLIAVGEKDENKVLTVIMGCADDDGRYYDTVSLLSAMLGK